MSPRTPRRPAPAARAACTAVRARTRAACATVRARTRTRTSALAAALVVLALGTVVGAGAPARAQDAPPTIPIDRPTRVLVLGDSVLLGAAGEIPAACAGCEVEVDAEESRSTATSVQAGEGHGEGFDVVVALLGHNDASNRDAYQRGFGELFDHYALVPRIIVLTLHETRPTFAEVNAFLRQAAEVRPNVTVLDWHAAVEADPGAVVGDGLHLTPTGAQLLAAQIGAAVDAARNPPPTPDTEPGGDATASTPVTPYIPDGSPGATVWDEPIPDPLAADDLPALGEVPSPTDRGTGTRVALVAILAAIVAVLAVAAVARARTRTHRDP